MRKEQTKKRGKKENNFFLHWRLKQREDKSPSKTTVPIAPVAPPREKTNKAKRHPRAAPAKSAK
jgi:hypothetical protein